jgi:hypothetical protein
MVNMVGLAPIIRAWVESPVTGQVLELEQEWVSACGFTYVPYPYGDTPDNIGEFDPFYSAYTYRVALVPGSKVKEVAGEFDGSNWFKEDIYPTANGNFRAHGNVDWTGVVDGEPVVLTWHGPTTRYFYYGGAPDPGGTGTTWAGSPIYSYRYPINEVYCRGQMIYRTSGPAVHGAAIYTTETGDHWLIVSTVQWYGIDYEIWAKKLVLGEDLLFTATGDAQKLWEGTWTEDSLDSGHYHSTIVAYRHDGAQGVFVLNNGSLVTIEISDTEIEEEGVTITIPEASVSLSEAGVPEPLSYKTVDSTEIDNAYLPAPDGYFSKARVICSATYTAEWEQFKSATFVTNTEMLSFWEGIVGNYTVDSVRAIQRQTSRRRLICADYKGDELVKVYVNVYPSINVLCSGSTCSNQDPDTGGSCGGSVFYSAGDTIELDYLGKHVLNEYFVITTGYSDRRSNYYYSDSYEKEVTYNSSATCIRYMDLRNDSLYLGYGRLSVTEKETTTTVIPYPSFYGAAYKIDVTTNTTAYDPYMELLSGSLPSIVRWSPLARASTSGQSITTMISSWSACTLQVIESPSYEEELFSRAAPYGSLSSLIHTWLIYPAGPLEEWPYNFRGYHTIAHNCKGDRMVALQDFGDGGGYAYWLSTVTTPEVIQLDMKQGPAVDVQKYAASSIGSMTQVFHLAPSDFAFLQET